MWMLAIGCGMVVGKTIIHSMILSRFLRLKMFRADQACERFFRIKKSNSKNNFIPQTITGFMDGPIFHGDSLTLPFLTCLQCHPCSHLSCIEAIYHQFWNGGYELEVWKLALASLPNHDNFCLVFSLMKAAACGTWLGDLITALIVTDMMLQDNFYPGWAPKFR